jgi:serine/threonine-protein kinase
LGTEAEMEFWREVKDSDDPEELELYIEQFPQGVYVELARKKIAELGG